MIEYLQREATKICNQISEYARKWKQPINISKTEAQIFFSQVTIPTMDGQKIKIVKSFKYLPFIWTSKLSLKPTIDKCVENIQKSFIKLKWLKAGNTPTTPVFTTSFFAYSFPHFAWLFPLLPKTHQETLRSKCRIGIRLVHRCQYIPEHILFETIKENYRDLYVKKYIPKRPKQMHKSDLGKSFFYNDIFYWDEFKKRKGDHLGHFFPMKRVKNLKRRHGVFLMKWIEYIQ